MEERLHPSNIQIIGEPYLTPNQVKFRNYMSLKHSGKPFDTSGITIRAPQGYEMPSPPVRAPEGYEIPRSARLDESYNEMMNKHPMTYDEYEAIKAAEYEKQMEGKGLWDRLVYGWNTLFGGN